MKKITLNLALLCLAFMLSFNSAEGQSASIDLGSQRQTITGFGGMNFPRWIADLTSAQADKAFGNGTGQIGLSILRISVSPNSSDWSLEVPTAQRAKNHGAIILATPWSPPASMKTNNSTIQGELRTDAYGDYANYLTSFANYMSSNGAELYAISVQNEPDWLPDYESCGWSYTQMYNFVRNYAGSIPTRVLAAEALGFNKAYTDPILNDATARANIDIVGGHLYGTSPSDYPLARNNGKEIWMTEHYTSSNVDANSWPDALGVGKEIHNCMINYFNAYIWWYIRRSYGPIDENGNVTKRGYVMSHFSKFVRPGFKRIDATSSPATNVSVSAYTDGTTVVIVAINQNSYSSNVTFNLSGGTVNSFTKYETTSSSNVSNVGTISAGSSMSNSLSANSITTYVGSIGSSTVGNESIWLEAECGTVGSLWNTVSDGNASNGEYVTVQSGNNSTESAPTSASGQISYTFNVSEGGSYSLWARVTTPNGNDDSFWISVDGGSWFLWNNIGPNSSWVWEQAQTYSLATGSHTLTVAYREDGALLDKILISNTGATPSGEGSAASNCGGTTGDYTIAVRAMGTNGSEQISLAVGGTALQTWTLGTSMGDYTATTSLSGNITVEFTNDDGTNRDVQVDYIQINGATTLQAEDQATNTGVWQNSACGGQYSEWLHCNGYIEFSAFKSVGATKVEDYPANNNISVYPNPAGDILNIFVPGLGEGAAVLSIYNINGKAVKTAIVEKGENSININGLEAGLYVVVVNYDNEQVARKFMKK